MPYTHDFVACLCTFVYPNIFFNLLLHSELMIKLTFLSIGDRETDRYWLGKFHSMINKLAAKLYIVLPRMDSNHPLWHQEIRVRTKKPSKRTFKYSNTENVFKRP